LGFSALFISFRTLEAPFTLAGVLMMYSKLTALNFLPDIASGTQLKSLTQQRGGRDIQKSRLE
jgi:hypothetical protein